MSSFLKQLSQSIAIRSTQILYEGKGLLKDVVDTSQIRHMSRVKTRFTMPPFWQPKPTRVLYPENVTRENEKFVEKVIGSQYSSPLRTEIRERGTWKPGSFRCGLIGKKIGICPMWKKSGKRVLTTLIQIPDNHVIKYIPPDEVRENDFKYKKRAMRYNLGALIVGADSADPRLFTKEYFRLFETSGVMPKRKLSKFYISSNAILSPGTPLFASHFKVGDRVDIHGVTIDRGFQGVMKRWGFKGGRASHGVTRSHRRPGNIGSGGEKARVLPGTKMPGHMGRHHRTLCAVEICRINTEYNVIWVVGPAIPGETGKYVILYDSSVPTYRKTYENPPHFPTFFQEEAEDLPKEMYADTFHDFASPSITFTEE